MAIEEIPTRRHGMLLSKWGRISTYAERELNNIHRELVFSQLINEGELIKRLKTIINNINKLDED